MSDPELRPGARELIDLARVAQTPSDAHRERAFEALMVGLGAAASGTPSAASTAGKLAGKSGFAWLKWALPAAVVASGIVGLGGYVTRPHPSSTVVTKPDDHSSTIPSAPNVASAPSADLRPAPGTALSAAPAASVTAEASALAASKAPALTKSAAADDLGQELALLHQALAASRSGNAAGALSLAQQHARQYPNSKLRVERDAIEVRSLCQLGRAAEAHKIADRLRAQTPNSPVSAALEETCVGK